MAANHSKKKQKKPSRRRENMRPSVEECGNYWLAVALKRKGTIVSVEEVYPATGRDHQAQLACTKLNNNAAHGGTWLSYQLEYVRKGDHGTPAE